LTEVSCDILFKGWNSLTLSNPIFLPPTNSPALIYFGQERGWWITCNYPTVLKEKNRNRKSTTCVICWLKSVLHEEKLREQKYHNVGWSVRKIGLEMLKDQEKCWEQENHNVWWVLT
jgi:hypothetical protein